ncbi:hypothetical protein GCM10010145_62190 [Streptomyces ruber]|uniref:Uncharacterized protein n=2 Tax=Streptomyces TaxID=1883 RepID=A0A918BQU8_9ACTN|nr:hypothetical protein GCM10010145_62190 [Streptomyces ruber]
MGEDLEDGAAVAVRLAGGAPLREALAVVGPGDWLVLDAGGAGGGLVPVAAPAGVGAH